jgi:hypothetical protein
LDRSVKILEVGSNLGNQLLSLQKVGFENLYGIEVNSYAIEQAKANTKNINIIRGDVFDIPFKDRCFDIVFTSGVLIHIAPQDIEGALKEIHRCSRNYIWGTDFAGLYLNSFEDLYLVREKKLKYLENENVDTMFLIRKRNS